MMPATGWAFTVYLEYASCFANIISLDGQRSHCVTRYSWVRKLSLPKWGQAPGSVKRRGQGGGPLGYQRCENGGRMQNLLFRGLQCCR